jgi:hypothetical protein
MSQVATMLCYPYFHDIALCSLNLWNFLKLPLDYPIWGSMNSKTKKKERNVYNIKRISGSNYQS